MDIKHLLILKYRSKPIPNFGAMHSHFLVQWIELYAFKIEYSQISNICTWFNELGIILMFIKSIQCANNHYNLI